MFHKVARVQPLGALEMRSGNLRTARRSKRAGSYYMDGARVLPVGDLLARVASQYAISDDPSDYLYEAIRANTTNVPNENHDGFHQTELLRFDTRLGQPVYMTYAGKPHHVDHKTDNPLAARGVIIDAHYHDAVPALASCPGCGLDTSKTANLDATKIHCKRCGRVVRDEFVEILVAVDTRKDPDFAKGVKNGTLNAGSMGCNCLSTTCNVCGNVAYSKAQFCEHIRAGNKGSLWQRRGSFWTRTSPWEVQRQASRHKYNWDAADFCYLTLGDLEVRKAFEYCQQVVFDEYSRVGTPADPKALQREVLPRAASATTGRVPTKEELRMETHELLRGSAARRTAAHDDDESPDDDTGEAHSFVVVRVNGDVDETYAGESVEEICDVYEIDPEQDEVRFCEVEAADEEAAIGCFDDATAKLFSDKEASGRESDIVVEAPPDEAVIVRHPPSGGKPGGPPSAGPGGPPKTIEQFQSQEPDGPPPGPPGGPAPGPQTTPAEMGIMPPGASVSAKKDDRPMKFREHYKDWEIKVSHRGNAQLFNARGVPVAVFRGTPSKDHAAQRKFAQEIVRSLMADGFVPTVAARNGILSPRLGQVVDHAIDDMKEFADKYMYDSVLDEAVVDMQDDVRGNPPTSVPEGGVTDMAGNPRRPAPKTTQDDGGVDHAEGRPEGIQRVTQEDHTDMADSSRSPVNLGKDDVLSGGARDHGEKLARLARVGARIRHRSLPGVTWTVRQAGQPRGSRLPSVIVSAPNRRARRVQGTDLIKYWLPAGAPPRRPQQDTARPATAKQPSRAAAVARSPVAQPPRAQPPREDMSRQVAVAEERLKKLFASREAKLKQAHQAEVKQAQGAAVQAFCRAMRLANERQVKQLEASPLRDAIVSKIASPQPLLQHPTGEVEHYPGHATELAQYLAAQVLNESSRAHLDRLMERAADLTAKGDQYLLDAEGDVRRMQAALPPLRPGLVPQTPAGWQAQAVRQAAMSGNHLAQINSTPTSFEAEGAPGIENRRAAIRDIVGSTTVAQQWRQYNGAH